MQEFNPMAKQEWYPFYFVQKTYGGFLIYKISDYLDEPYVIDGFVYHEKACEIAQTLNINSKKRYDENSDNILPA